MATCRSLWQAHLLMALLVFCPWASGARAKQEPLNVPPEDALDVRALQDTVRLAVARSIAYFQGLSAADPDGWFVPPLRRRTVVDWKTVDVRYTRKVVKHPVYEYETYETYERVQDKSEGSAKVLKKVTKRRIKRQIGTKDVTRLVHDPEGDVVREEKRPIYGPGGPDFWREGSLGINALIVYTMRTAGVGADDTAVAKVVGNLADFVDYYGIPDTTWDLSWLVSAFSVMPGDRYEDLTRICVSRLLDGQIQEGDARGLWGPMAIGSEVLAAMMKREAQFNEDYLRRKAQLADRATDLRKRRVEEAEAELRSWQAKMKKISLRGNRLDAVENAFVIEAPGFAPVQLTGAAYFFYNQVAADMASTAVALRGIAAAATANRLPELVERPKDERGNPVLRPQETSAILARAANALTASQETAGTWRQLNQHQPIHNFDGFDFLPVPADAGTFVELPSERTYLSALQGFSGLLNAGRAVGMDKLTSRFGSNLARAEASQRIVAGKLVEEGAEGENAGGFVAPYDIYLNLSGVHRRLDSPVEEHRPLWERLAWRLLMTANPDGTWDNGTGHFLTPSSRARMETLDRTRILNEDTLKSAHVPPNYDVPHQFREWMWFPRQPLATAYATLFFVDGVRPPVAGVCSFGSIPADSPVLAQSVRFLREKSDAPLTYEKLAAPFEYADVAAFPVLFVRGDGPLETDAGTREAIEDYLSGGGLVVVELPATPSGAAFMNDWVAVAKVVDAGAEVKPLAEEGYLGGLRDSVPVRTVYGDNDAPLVIFLPLPAGAGPVPRGALSVYQAAELTANILNFRVDLELMAEAFPVAAGEGEELTERWKVALGFLKGESAPKPVPDAQPETDETATPQAEPPPTEAAPEPEPAPEVEAIAEPIPEVKDDPQPLPENDEDEEADEPAPVPVPNQPPPPADDEVW